MKPMIALPVPILLGLYLSRLPATPAEPLVDYTISGTVTAGGAAPEWPGARPLPAAPALRRRAGGGAPFCQDVTQGAAHSVAAPEFSYSPKKLLP